MSINVTSKQKGNYEIEVTLRFDKEFLRLPRSARLRVSSKIDGLEMNPYSNKALHGDLSGLFSLRVGEIGYELVVMFSCVSHSARCPASDCEDPKPEKSVIIG